MRKILNKCGYIILNYYPIIISAVVILTAFFLIFINYSKSIDKAERIMFQAFRNKAQYICHLIKINENKSDKELLEIAKNEFLKLENKIDEYLCIVDSNANLILHTKYPNTVGNYAGNNPFIKDDAEFCTLGDFYNFTYDYVGYYVSSTGEFQIAAFSNIKTKHWTIGIHRSKEEVRDELIFEHKWLLTEYLVFGLLLLPMSVAILIWSLKSSDTNYKKQRHYLIKSQEIGKIGTWEIDLKSNKINWTKEAYKIFEIPEGKELDFDVFMQCIHPKDTDFVNRKWQDGIKFKEYDIEHRIIVNEKIKWVREKATFQTDKNGNSIKAIGVTQDITEKKEVEEKLQRLYTAVEQSENCVIITDIDGNIDYVNKMFEKLTGYKKSEAIGKNPKILNSGKHTKEFYQDIWETILSGEIWKGEFINKKKNGDLYWEAATITPVKDSNNEILNFIAIKEDLTSQKYTEQRILKAIMETEEKERKRITEDLHDELGPFLSGIKLYVKELSYEDVSQEQRLSVTEYLNQFINEAIEKTRSISNQLMPNVLKDYGLIKALESFCSKINNTDKISISFKTRTNEINLDSTISVAIYRIIIELINNTIKHSDASQIEIEFNVSDKIVELIYFENGKGFDFKEKLESDEGLGLRNIVSRINSINGKLNYKHIANRGICFEMILDLSLIIKR